MNLRSTNRGFTLIELMLAIALSLSIVLVAFAGLRMASQCSAAANRLSTENALIRSGFLAALDELDFWTGYDDPVDPSRQRLRAHDSEHGLPFTPLQQAMTYRDSASREYQRGFDPEYPWLANDPATWYRGNTAERDITDLRFGRYACFSNADATSATSLLSIKSNVGDYGDVQVPHAWRDNQMRDLMSSLGYYASCEYMPANTLYGWYQSYQTDLTNAGGIPLDLIRQPVIDPFRFSGMDGGVRTPTGLLLLSFVASYALLNPNAPMTTDELLAQNRRHFRLGYDSSPALIAEFRDRTENSSPLLTTSPSHWPRVDWSVDHYVLCKRFFALCRIRWTSPLTGVSAELSFSGVGTTLRGARQQRSRDAGWARWNNSPNFSNDPTLDAPPAPWRPRPHP